MGWNYTGVHLFELAIAFVLDHCFLLCVQSGPVELFRTSWFHFLVQSIVQNACYTQSGLLIKLFFFQTLPVSFINQYVVKVFLEFSIRPDLGLPVFHFLGAKGTPDHELFLGAVDR